jgi:SPP1 family predicted phage head-tail adaptor
MNFGSMRHRVTIQRLTKSDNPFDTPDTWTTIATMWADIKHITSKDVYQTGQMTMQVSHKIIVRYPGKSFQIMAGDKLLSGSRVFELQTGIVNTDERNRTLELMAFELDPVQ